MIAPVPSLSEIVSTTLHFDPDVGVEARAAAEAAVLYGNTAIELAHLLAQGEAPAHLRELLTNALDEAFIDLHVAVSLAACGRQKQSLVIARGLLEVLLYCVHFVDHPIEARLWIATKRDMSFSETIQTMDAAYFVAARCPTPDEKRLDTNRLALRDVYRLMSERLHGKIAFAMPRTIELPSDVLREFCATFGKGILSLTYVIFCRMPDSSAVVSQIPALKGLVSA